jgi:hypothetical protein
MSLFLRGGLYIFVGCIIVRSQLSKTGAVLWVCTEFLHFQVSLFGQIVE